jgi:hypothetical protein
MCHSVPLCPRRASARPNSGNSRRTRHAPSGCVLVDVKSFFPRYSAIRSSSGQYSPPPRASTQFASSETASRYSPRAAVFTTLLSKFLARRRPEQLDLDSRGIHRSCALYSPVSPPSKRYSPPGAGPPHSAVFTAWRGPGAANRPRIPAHTNKR